MIQAIYIRKGPRERPYFSYVDLQWDNLTYFVQLSVIIGTPLTTFGHYHLGTFHVVCIENPRSLFVFACNTYSNLKRWRELSRNALFVLLNIIKCRDK